MTARTRRAQARVMPRAEDMAQGDDQHQRIRAIEFLPHIATFHIKVFADASRPGSRVKVGAAMFCFHASEDMHQHFLTHVEAFVTTPSSSGIVEVQIDSSAQALMLTTPITIDANEKNSKTAAVEAVIDPSSNFVNWGDEIRIDVDEAGTGARGLGVILEFML